MFTLALVTFNFYRVSFQVRWVQVRNEKRQKSKFFASNPKMRKEKKW